MTEGLRTQLMADLRIRGVDSRPYFYPVSAMPMYQKANTPVTHQVFMSGINLPSYYDITQNDVDYVCEQVKASLSFMKML
jgi:perosamine synthetase